MARSFKLLSLLAVAAVAACTDGRTPVSPALAPAGGPSATIWDGAHAALAYDSKFYFLPPMVKNPKDDFKSADGTLHPIVEVCELNAGGSCARLIDRFGPDGGSKTNENVRWLGNHYQVDFHAGSYVLDVSKKHRVSVFVNGLLLGWADVIVGNSAKDFRGVDPEQYVTITSSQTLAIKFRIGNGIAAALTLTPPTQTVPAGTGATYTAAVTDLHGNVLTVPITWSSSDPSIASVDANGVVTTYRPGTVTITATAERVSATATLIVTANDPPHPARIVVDPAVMNVGNTRTLTATVYDQYGQVMTGQPITWTLRAEDGSIVRLTSTDGTVKGLAAGAAVATADVGTVSGTGPVTVTTNIELPAICSTDGLVYFGATTILPNATCGIRLTPSENWTAGSAWSTTKQPVANGFEARFSMRMSNPGPGDLLVQGNTAPGADGIVFVIQNMSQTAVGGAGVGIGYQGLSSSVAVEFDTWLNPGDGDVSSNSVSIHTNGTDANNANEAYSLAQADLPGDLYDNQVHDVVIRYVPGTLTVILDGVTVATAPLNLTNINGASILDADGKAWAGFTSATGGAYGTHDILSWSMYTPAAP